MFTQLGWRPDLPKAVERLLCLQGRSKWDELTIQRTKDCITGKGKDGLFLQIKTLYFFIIKFQINIFLAMTVQFDAVQCVFYYKINKTLLLGNFTVQTLLIRSPSLKSTLSAYWAGGAGYTGSLLLPNFVLIDNVFTAILRLPAYLYRLPIKHLIVRNINKINYKQRLL